MVTRNGVIVLTATRKSTTKKGQLLLLFHSNNGARTHQNVTLYVRYISCSACARCVILRAKIDNHSTDQTYYCSLLLFIDVIFQSFSYYLLVIQRSA